jgi:hypothetical protein
MNPYSVAEFYKRFGTYCRFHSFPVGLLSDPEEEDNTLLLRVNQERTRQNGGTLQKTLMFTATVGRHSNLFLTCRRS